MHYIILFIFCAINAITAIKPLIDRIAGYGTAMAKMA